MTAAAAAEGAGSTGAGRRGGVRHLVPLLLCVTALAVIYGRLTWQGCQPLRAAQAAVAHGDPGEAIRCYRDALRAYVPGTPYERRALDGLETIASAARAAGDQAGERRAWEAVRVGLLSVRSFYLPEAARYAQAQRRLAELDAAAEFPPASASAGLSSPTEAVRPDLAVVSIRGNGPGRSVRPLGPAVASTMVALIGFALWVGSVIVLIRRGVARMPGVSSNRAVAGAPSSGRQVVGRVLPPVLFVVGFALFLLGLRFA